MRLLGLIYDLRLTGGQTLKNPASLDFRFNPEHVFNNRKVAVYRLNEHAGSWTYIGGRLSSTNNMVNVRLWEFSKYALIENDNLRLFEDVAGRWSRDGIY